MLQHKMNPTRTAFTTEPIGSFVRFYKEIESDGAVGLYGEARVPKRDKRIMDMLARMYDSGRLHVSFEIMASNCLRDGGVVVIDASPENNLLAMAIVSCPAYEDSNALLMVAGKEEVDGEPIGEQIEAVSAAENGEGENMNDEKMIPEEKVEDQVEETKAEEPKPVETEVAQQEETEEPKEEEHPAVEQEVPSAEEPKEEEQQEEEEIPQPAETLIPAVEPEEIIEDVAELHREIEELKAQIEMLMPYKLAAEKQEREAKMASMRAFAQKNGLDQENEKVAAAIGAMDYQALMELSMEVTEEKPEPQVQMASFMPIEQKDTRAFLYERGTYKHK